MKTKKTDVVFEDTGSNLELFDYKQDQSTVVSTHGSAETGYSESDRYEESYSGNSIRLKQEDKIHIHSHKFDHRPPLKIVSGSFSVGKSETNEDAHFITERGFGVADGVSGWIDFGFSSEAFSKELMNNCKV